MYFDILDNIIKICINHRYFGKLNDYCLVSRSVQDIILDYIKKQDEKYIPEILESDTPELFRLLLENGIINNDTKIEDKPLIFYYIDKQYIKHLNIYLHYYMKKGENADYIKYDMMTPLYYVLYENRRSPLLYDIVKILLYYGADPNSINVSEYGINNVPLLMAIFSEVPNRVNRLLLKYGADPNTPNCYHHTAVYNLAELYIYHNYYQHRDAFNLMMLLLEYGGDLKILKARTQFIH